MQMTDRPQDLVTLAPRIQRLIAPNPGPMTYWGTNTYVLGQRDLVVVDPGPDLPAHLDRLANLPGPGAQIAAILVTHAHLDHSGGAAALSRATGAPVHAFGNALAGRSPIMADLAAAGGLEGGEGVDAAFRPDHILTDGAQLDFGDLRIEAIWTPGHMANHLCFALPNQGIVLTGDLVMGWTTTLISPPDGDLGGYLSSLDRLAARQGDNLYLPAHGAPIDAPADKLAALRAHRLHRHAEIRAALSQGPATATGIARRVYTDLAPGLLPAATRNTFAHLIEMVSLSQAEARPKLSADAVFSAL